MRSGDRLVVEVFNGLEGDEGVSIHWHGLTMRGMFLSTVRIMNEILI